jgi:hypothetical protein
MRKGMGKRKKMETENRGKVKEKLGESKSKTGKYG